MEMYDTKTNFESNFEASQQHRNSEGLQYSANG